LYWGLQNLNKKKTYPVHNENRPLWDKTNRGEAKTNRKFLEQKPEGNISDCIYYESCHIIYVHACYETNQF
jgi:hypothetical protein